MKAFEFEPARGCQWGLSAHAQWLAALLVLAPATVATQARGADTVLVNGYVYTVDPQRRIAQAIAIDAGRIVYVGDDNGVSSYIEADTETIKLDGRMVMPGIHDGHLHFLALGTTLQCSLDYAALTMPQVRARITACLGRSQDAPLDSLLQVFNWAWQKVQPPGATYSKADLDALVTQRPIALRATNTHVTVVNSRALELAGITAHTADPLGGEIQRDAHGDPTGVLIDAAQQLVLNLAAPMNAQQHLDAVATATRAMNIAGATSFMEAGSTEATLQAVRALQRAGKLTLRGNFSVQISPMEARNPAEVLKRVEALRRGYSDPALSARPGMRIGTLKLFIDGDFMSPSLRGAFLEPYVRDVGSAQQPVWQSTDNHGELYFPQPVLTPLMQLLERHGWQFHGHANGDRAIRSVLDTVASVQEANHSGAPADNRRHTLTHLLLIDDADIPRFAKLGVIASMSLQWPQRDEYHVDLTAPYIGPQRFKRIYATRPLVETGARIAYGSDAPVDPLNYWYAMEVAVTRTGEGEGKYAGPLNSAYAISLEQAIEAFTINSAYQLRQERLTGSLEVGKFADLIVLDQNLFEIPIAQVSDTTVLMTMVGGDIVYQVAPTK